MTNKQYKNIIQMTLLNKENTVEKEDVEVLKKIFDNCGVPFPTGTKEEVRTALKSGTYVGWAPCSAAEAQAAANEGIASIGISNEKAYVVEPEVTETLSISTEINSEYSVNTTALNAEEEESTEFFAQAKFEHDANGNISVMSTGTTTEEFTNSWRINSSVRNQAISKMNNYYNTNYELQSHIDGNGTCVFAFEGLGDPALKNEDNIASNRSNTSSFHPIWLYNAMMIVTEGKNIKYVTRRASTLPDVRPGDTEYADPCTLKEGIYEYMTGTHSTYVAMVPTDDDRDAWYLESSNFTTKKSQGTNLHAGHQYFYNDGSNNSEGCQIVHYKDYVQFGKAVGFLKNVENITSISGKFSDYLGSEIGLPTSSNSNNITIKYILNREYDNQNPHTTNQSTYPNGVFYPN